MPWSTRVVLLAIALGAFGGTCDGFYTVRGRVIDCTTRRPIEGAHLALSGGSADRPRASTYTTGDDGEYGLYLNEPPGDGTATLRAEREGYRSLRRDVRHSPESQPDVCLEPIASGGASGATR